VRRGPMVRQEVWMDVKLMHRQGHLLRQIARVTGLSRVTVRRILSSPTPRGYGPRPPRPGKPDPPLVSDTVSQLIASPATRVFRNEETRCGDRWGGRLKDEHSGLRQEAPVSRDRSFVVDIVSGIWLWPVFTSGMAVTMCCRELPNPLQGLSQP